MTERPTDGDGAPPPGAQEAPGAPPADAAPASPRHAPHRAGRSSANARRRRAREFALQGLYEWLVARGDAGAVDAHVREQDGFAEADAVHFDALLHGCIREAAELQAVFARHTDRKLAQLSPVEHAALLIGTYELRHCLDVPYRVALNEAVELAKAFGGTDGHKFVNGVIDKVAADLRAAEVAAARRRG